MAKCPGRKEGSWKREDRAKFATQFSQIFPIGMRELITFHREGGEAEKKENVEL